MRRLARQIDSRNQLLDETEKQARLLRGEIARTDSVAGNLSAKLERDRAQYGEMVREAYRNYKHNNYLTYIFSSRDFTDVARQDHRPARGRLAARTQTARHRGADRRGPHPKRRRSTAASGHSTR